MNYRVFQHFSYTIRFFKILLTVVLAFLLCSSAYSQQNGQGAGSPASLKNAKGPWKGKKSAVVLTYDDGLNVHLSHAIPALDSLGLKGTFYISDYFGGLKNQIAGWRKAALKGHELGNHTVY